MSNDMRPNNDMTVTIIRIVCFFSVSMLTVHGWRNCACVSFVVDISLDNSRQLNILLHFGVFFFLRVGVSCYGKSVLPFCPETSWPEKLMECIWSWRSLKSNWPKRRTLDSTCQKENINKRCENTPLTTALAAHASLVFMVELVRFSRAQHYCFGQIYWFHLMGETHVACTMLAIGQRAMNLLKMPSCRFSICSSIEQKKKVTEFHGLQSKRSGRCVDGNY